jgi:hypothetical protein
MFESAFVPKAAERPEPTSRLLWVVFGLCILMLLYQLYDGWLGRQVSSRQPIGSVVKVTGEGSKWLVETENGFYPLSRALVVEKDTPLVLEIRGNGDRYVCNVTGSVCGRTAKQGFPKKQGLGSQ